ncbi:MAG: asparaginase [Magnetococcales bacterium]|nr:asparaginase [Magnetococcales bacterium]
MSIEPVALTDLEKDDRIDEVMRFFSQTLKQESAFAKLKSEQQEAVSAILQSLTKMRFENIASFQQVASSQLKTIAPELDRYVPIAIDNARGMLSEKQGVLVIYTGGTIGSAPKDPDDPESPQVVKPWKDLKNAGPMLGALGYPVDAVAFVDPLDSCNVGPPHWLAILRIIQANYSKYSGFVVLHGTDSMVYTASALSFMMLDLGKPVVITGSQIAGIVNPRNDAHQNMITAIMLANPEANNLEMIPEVIISFGNIIIRGCRSKKMNVIEYQGFDSPNYPRLGKAGDHIMIERKHLRKAPELDVEFMEDMDTNVIIVEVFPGMQHSPVLANILKDSNLRGVVLKAYGAGNIPTDPPFLNLFRDFIDRGGVVVCTTSCPAGEVVMGLYETSQVLVDRGIIGGFDITPEAALCKLMVLLGKYGNDINSVKKFMQQSMAGEQRLSLETSDLPGKKTLTQGASPIEISGNLNSVADPERIDRVMLRFKNARLFSGSTDPDHRVTIKLFNDGETREHGENFLGAFPRRQVPAGALVQDESTGESLAIDLTLKKHLFLAKQSSARDRAKQKVRIGIALEGDAGASFAWEDAELNIYTME